MTREAGAHACVDRELQDPSCLAPPRCPWELPGGPPAVVWVSVVGRELRDVYVAGSVKPPPTCPFFCVHIPSLLNTPFYSDGERHIHLPSVGSENYHVFPPSHHCDDGHLRCCEHSRVGMRKWEHLSGNFPAILFLWDQPTPVLSLIPYCQPTMSSQIGQNSSIKETKRPGAGACRSERAGGAPWSSAGSPVISGHRRACRETRSQCHPPKRATTGTAPAEAASRQCGCRKEDRVDRCREADLKCYIWGGRGVTGNPRILTGATEWTEATRMGKLPGPTLSPGQERVVCSYRGLALNSQQEGKGLPNQCREGTALGPLTLHVGQRSARLRRKFAGAFSSPVRAPSVNTTVDVALPRAHRATGAPAANSSRKTPGREGGAQGAVTTGGDRRHPGHTPTGWALASRPRRVPWPPGLRVRALAAAQPREPHGGETCSPDSRSQSGAGGSVVTTRGPMRDGHAGRPAGTGPAAHAEGQALAPFAKARRLQRPVGKTPRASATALARNLAGRQPAGRARAQGSRAAGYVQRADVTPAPPPAARPYSVTLARAHHCVAGLGRRCGALAVPAPAPRLLPCGQPFASQPSGPPPAADMPRVYIGRLSYNVREKDIQRFFSGYGRLLEIDLKNGYGFVEFEDSRDADDAVYELNGKELCGERVIVEHARGPRRDRDGYSYGSRSGGGGYSSRRTSGRDKYGPPVRTEFRLIVENLSSRCSWQDLKDFMRQAGEVTYADAHKERTNEGVIEFRSYSDMKRALDKLDGTEINGRNIRLIEDKPRTSHRRSYSGSRSRSRSRRRSRSRSRRSSRSRSRSISKSRSRSRSRSKGRSRSRSKGRKSRSKSKSKPKSDRGSRSRSRSRSKDEYEKSRSRSRSRSRSPKENGKGDIKSKSRSRSQSRSNSPPPAPPSKARSVSPPPKRASRSRSKS
ncbi:Serine/arginine-rich splicing factor 6, partial [Galemys pyrenaicus]